MNLYKLEKPEKQNGHVWQVGRCCTITSVQLFNDTVEKNKPSGRLRQNFYPVLIRPAAILSCKLFYLKLQVQGPFSMTQSAMNSENLPPKCGGTHHFSLPLQEHKSIQSFIEEAASIGAPRQKNLGLSDSSRGVITPVPFQH